MAQPADPVHANIFAQLPEELWGQICQFVVQSLTSDFVVTTAIGVAEDKGMALAPFGYANQMRYYVQNHGPAADDIGADEFADNLVSGVVVNGKLYMTKIPDRHPGAFLGEGEAEDNGSWFSHVHRDENGSVDYTRTPQRAVGVPARHRFFKDARDGTVLMHSSREEEAVVQQRHRVDDLDVTHGSGYALQYHFRARMRDRRLSVLNEERFRYMPLEAASAGTQTGHLTLVHLSRGLRLRVKLVIEGALPLLTRVDVFNPEDELATMETPFDVRSQMSYSLDKWLAVVPLTWLVAQQSHGASGAKMDASACAHTMAALEAGALNHNTKPHQLLVLNTAKRYEHTSFRAIAPAMVYAFYAQPFGTIDLNSVQETVSLLDTACANTLFQIDYAIGGRHVPLPKKGASVEASSHHRTSDAQVDLSPEMDLLGGVSAYL